jgi:hypothetical protein
MTFLEDVKERVIDWLRPGTRQALGEHEAMKQLYSNSNAQNIIPGQWYSLLNQNGDRVGFSYVCNCGREHQLINAFEWLRMYTCGACRARFDLLKSAGIKGHDGECKKPEEWEAFLRKLPIRPRLAGGPPRQPFIDTWGASGDCETRYELSDPGNLPQR